MILWFELRKWTSLAFAANFTFTFDWKLIVRVCLIKNERNVVEIHCIPNPPNDESPKKSSLFKAKEKKDLLCYIESIVSVCLSLTRGGFVKHKSHLRRTIKCDSIYKIVSYEFGRTQSCCYAWAFVQHTALWAVLVYCHIVGWLLSDVFPFDRSSRHSPRMSAKPTSYLRS